MLDALAITIGAIVVGAGLGVAAGQTHPALGVLRTFAVTAVGGVVLFQLLPEAIDTLGPVALLVFVASLAAPLVLARLWHGPDADDASIAFELAFLGFAAHQLAEGLAVGTYAGPHHAAHGHQDLIYAVAAHTIPLTALVIAGAAPTRGQVVGRTAVLLAATAAGFLGAKAVGVHFLRAEPWLAATVAGLLCHVLLHDHVAHAPRPPWVRPLDAAAALLGAAVPFLGGHGLDEGSTYSTVVRTLVELTLETAPMLLAGLVLAALLQRLSRRLPPRWLGRGHASRQAVRGIAIGALFPLERWQRLSTISALREHGGGPAMVVAFTMASPQLAPEGLALGVHLLGWPFTLAWIAAALVLAYATGVLLVRIAPPVKARPDRWSPRPEGAAGGPIEATYRAFDGLLGRVGPWTGIGLLAAAYLSACVPDGAWADGLPAPVEAALVGMVALPAFACPTAALPVAAIAVVKGLSPGAVLVGLVLGSATNLATMKALTAHYGRAAVWPAMAFALLATLGLGWIVDLAGPTPQSMATWLQPHPHPPLHWLAAAALATATVAQLWRSGLSGWIASFGHAHSHPHH